MTINFLKVTAIVAVMCIGSPVLALEKPLGEVILTVSGNVSNTNTGGVAQFDASMLGKLASRHWRMETPWSPGKVVYSGPLLRAVLDEAGATGKTLIVRALNDYMVDLPIEDAWEIDTILATAVDGKVMSVRDKGPLFLIYPFDQRPDLYNEKYFTRSVWQIREIEVR